jgi:hypothetical protein
VQEASRHDFTGCGKTRSGGRPGIYPRHKANRINRALAPAVCFLSDSFENRAFPAASLAPNPEVWACFVRHCVHWRFRIIQNPFWPLNFPFLSVRGHYPVTPQSRKTLPIL